MERRGTVLLLCFMLVWIPFPTSHDSSDTSVVQLGTRESSPSHELIGFDTLTGTLNPLNIEHIGTIAGASEYFIGRTDVETFPGSEVWLPLGSSGNSYSADCEGGYFLVGAGGSADFSTPTGTISLWLKWDLNAPHGRFWGQHSDFETRWSSNRLMLDWGSDNTFQGLKSDWISNHWYFIAITWDESTNSISLYWGDEDQEPVVDLSTSSWTATLSGLHSENDIMNSRAHATGQVDGHVDEFRYYSVVRNLEELRSDYNVTLTGTEQGLTHYYRFEDDLEDSAGNENLVPIDATSFSHDVYIGGDEWRAEQIEINIRNLKTLYVLNGSFDTGSPGVN
ncbi:MAG: LamG-like jellyroll fold domain-containing protein, partial [Candidatus Thorarchaeota archaeon]